MVTDTRFSQEPSAIVGGGPSIAAEVHNGHHAKVSSDDLDIGIG